MKVDCIFAEIKKSLWSVRYESDEYSAYAGLLELWSDPEFLFDFFEQHLSDLQSGFFGEITIEDAVLRTIDEAEALEQLLKQTIELSETDAERTLQQLFAPLQLSEENRKLHQKNKLSRSWLRMYAIRIAPNRFVVSGGAIKLTETMNEREHLLLELRKLELVKNYLKAEGLLDEEDFEYIEIN